MCTNSVLGIVPGILVNRHTKTPTMLRGPHQDHLCAKDCVEYSKIINRLL